SVHEVADLRTQLLSCDAERLSLTKKLFREQQLRENAELFAKEASAEREAALTEAKRVKGREISLHQQFVDMQVTIEGHQEMYSKLENRLKLAHANSDALSRGLKTTREVFKRKIVEYKSSFDRLNALLLLSDPEDTPLTQKRRARVRELVAENKRLQKIASSLRSRIRLDDMDPETLICMLEGTLPSIFTNVHHCANSTLHFRSRSRRIRLGGH
ncbi:hypothetical protein PHMEG_00032418, partial [Phytophthora megakarya]